MEGGVNATYQLTDLAQAIELTHFLSSSWLQGGNAPLGNFPFSVPRISFPEYPGTLP